MMPLSVAMAMSGLEADDFSDFPEIYNHGVALIDNNKGNNNNNNYYSNNNSGRSSIASNASTSSNYNSSSRSSESGIVMQFNQNERQNLSRGARSGPSSLDVNRHEDNNNNNNDDDDDLATRKKMTCCDKKNDAHANATDNEKTDIINVKKEVNDVKKDGDGDKDDLRIMYQNKNLLDLGANVQDSWKLNFAVLEGGVNCFFENRSQLSRVANLEPPPHISYTCNECDFVMQHYF